MYQLTQEQEYEVTQSISTPNKNGYFGLQNSDVPHMYNKRFFFLSTLNIMISQMVKNEYERFDVYKLATKTYNLE
jgi:hypothetical protein